MRHAARVLAGTMLLAAACSGRSPTESQQPQERQESLGIPFELALGQSIVIPSESLRVTFQRVIEDSRCPAGAQCIWQGEVVAAIGLEVAGGAPVSFQLATISQRQQSVSGYSVQLLDASSGLGYRLQLLITR